MSPGKNDIISQQEHHIHFQIFIKLALPRDGTADARISNVHSHMTTIPYKFWITDNKTNVQPSSVPSNQTVQRADSLPATSEGPQEVLDTSKFQLDIPDNLFSSSFTTVTKVSKRFGDFIMASARRAALFAQYLQTIFKGV